MPSKYLQRVAARRYDTGDDIQRGMQVGQEIGKLLGGLGTAIQAAKKDQIANQLMTQQSISEQPGAGQTIDLGTLPSDGSSDGSSNVASDDQLRQAMAASQLSSSSGQAQDLGQLPSSDPMTPGPTGTQQPMPDPGVSDDQLRQAMAASRLSGGSPTVATLGGPQPNAKAPITGSGDMMFNPSDYIGGGGKGSVGGLVHTGGTAEMELQDKMLEQQYKRAQVANMLAETAGTGRYAKRATPVTKQGVTMTGGDSVWDSAGGGGSGLSKKPAKYTAGSGDFENDEATDQPDQIKTDFEAFHPGVDLGDFAGATRDANGNYVIPGKPDALGNPTVKATIPKAEGDQVMMRMDAARKRAGMASTNAAVPQGQGTQDNPVPLTGSKLQLRSLNVGTWVIDPKTGKKYRIGA
jgi:hypothetical protein